MKKKLNMVLACALMMVLVLTACGTTSAEESKTQTTPETAAVLDDSSNKVVIYSGAEEYRNEYFLKRIKEEFPDYDVTIEYMPTGNLAAKLAAEGTQTDMDIFYDLDFSYAGLVEQYLADVSAYDQSIYVDDCKVENAHFLAATRNGGAIIIIPDVLKEKGIAEPTC
jgi:iron(III) transport system substrate-binding protein